MTDKKNINKLSLILHSIFIYLLLLLNESTPTWFNDYINPEEALSTQENVIILLVGFPVIFLIGLWFKSLFNTIIPNIFNFREISYWEAYGLLLILMFMAVL